ncbi:LIC_10190 family membrane protein [Raineya orbicola]|uniref:DUF8201 domain-containing protein n=1 Tax=Raineya orbicola TaxID=2016530 RepID=A0A2N3I9W1_9BACT|nr:hypothetical protein [Raineya orbicola]PKQ67023.1 hypothetical protein Rain11_2186 [Raineya orbicola]
MIVILLSWVNIFFLSYTWGRFFITAILEKWFKTSFQSIVLCNFIGLAILNWLVDIFAIYIPINYKFQIALELLSFIIWLLLLKKKKIYLPSTICSKKKIFFLIIFLYAFLATWIRCFFATGHYDEGLYYIQHVRWLQNYGFVNGLANLHTRFGFNSNWHNLSSLFEYSYFSKNYFHNDLNGFLFIIFIATSIKGLYAIFQKNARISHYLSTFFVLPLIYPEANFFTFGSSYVNTISPDWASYIFVSITFILLAESIERYQPTEKISLIVVASLMSIYSFSIKISNIPMILISIFGLFLILTLKLKLKEIFFFICINLLLIIPSI